MCEFFRRKKGDPKKKFTQNEAEPAKTAVESSKAGEDNPQEKISTRKRYFAKSKP